MNSSSDLAVDILSSWQIRHPVEVRLEQLYISPSAPFLVKYFDDPQRCPRVCCRSDCSACCSSDNALNNLHYKTRSIATVRNESQHSRSVSCRKQQEHAQPNDIQYNRRQEDMLGFRVIGRLAVNGHSVCEPSISSVGCLDIKRRSCKKAERKSSISSRCSSSSRLASDSCVSYEKDDKCFSSTSGTTTSRSRCARPKTSTVSASSAPDDHDLLSSLTATPTRTRTRYRKRIKQKSRNRNCHQPLASFCCVVNFSSVLTFMYNISDLSLSTTLDLSILCIDLGLLVGHVSLPLFNPCGVLRKGRLLVPWALRSRSSETDLKRCFAATNIGAQKLQKTLSNEQSYSASLACVSDTDSATSDANAPSERSSFKSSEAQSVLAVLLDQTPVTSDYWFTRRKEKRNEIASHQPLRLTLCESLIEELKNKSGQEDAQTVCRTRQSDPTLDPEHLPTDDSAACLTPRSFAKTSSSSLLETPYEQLDVTEEDSDGVFVSSCSMASWLSCSTENSSDSCLKPTTKENSVKHDVSDSEDCFREVKQLPTSDVESKVEKQLAVADMAESATGLRLSGGMESSEGAWMPDPEISDKTLHAVARKGKVKIEKNGLSHQREDISTSSAHKSSKKFQKRLKKRLRFRDVKQHLFCCRHSAWKAARRAMHCYKMLDLLSRSAIASSPYSTDICRGRIERLCEKNILHSLPNFGFFAICLPTFGHPVLFSPSCYGSLPASLPFNSSSATLFQAPAEMFERSKKQRFLPQQTERKLKRFENNAENDFRRALAYELPRHSQHSELVQDTKVCDTTTFSSSAMANTVHGRVLENFCCSWFLDSWTPLLFESRKATLLWATKQSARRATRQRGFAEQPAAHGLYSSANELMSTEEETQASAYSDVSCSQRQPPKHAGPQNYHDFPTDRRSVAPWKGEGGGPMQFLSSTSTPIERLYHEQWQQLRKTAYQRKQKLSSNASRDNNENLLLKDEKCTSSKFFEDNLTLLHTYTPEALNCTHQQCGSIAKMPAPYTLPFGLSQPPYPELQYVMNIVSLPAFSPLSTQDKQLLWKYREVLRLRGVGLFKLCSSVKWDAVSSLEQQNVFRSVTEFFRLLDTWPLPSIENVLELLSPLSTVPAVRRFALKAMERMSDAQLYRFLPQLIQAARYDPPGNVAGAVLNFLIHRSTQSALIASHVHWGLLCESEDPQEGHVFIRGHQRLIDALSNPDAAPSCKRAWRVIELQKKLVRQLRSLATQIRGKRDRADRKTQRLCQLISATARVKKQTSSSGESGVEKTAGEMTKPTATTVEDLDLVHLDFPIPLPIAPHALLLGIMPEKSFVVRSSQYPIILACRVLLPPFATAEERHRETQQQMWLQPPISDALLQPQECSVVSGSKDYDRYADWCSSETELKRKGYTETVKRYLYKSGDDLRQDQLVTQFVSVIRSLLINYGCDYCLTLYNVASFSRNDGLIEFIEDSEAISSIKRTYPTLRQYFASKYPLPSSPLGFPLHVLDTFIRSCSGFSVITFLLAVGDRHLDNLLVSRDGRLFHVDFGFILGDDPKPFPPPMKLCSEMIDALGGIGSQGYTEFQLRCCQCFRCLRRHSKLILDILLLMVGSGIRGLRQDPLGVIGRVYEKFQLDVSEVEAEAYLLDVVSVSANALFPAVVDKFHEWSVYWK